MIDASGPATEETPGEDFAREIALRLLTVRPRTRAELAQALTKKNVPEAIAQRVLDRLSEVGLIDDAAFAELWTRSRRTNRHLSVRAVRRELATKGVDRDVADAALAFVGPEGEYDTALRLAEGKARSMTGLTPDVRYRRLAGILARRGFSSSVTHQVLREVVHGAADVRPPPD